MSFPILANVIQINVYGEFWEGYVYKWVDVFLPADIAMSKYSFQNSGSYFMSMRKPDTKRAKEC